MMKPFLSILSWLKFNLYVLLCYFFVFFVFWPMALKMYHITTNDCNGIHSHSQITLAANQFIPLIKLWWRKNQITAATKMCSRKTSWFNIEKRNSSAMKANFTKRICTRLKVQHCDLFNPNSQECNVVRPELVRDRFVYIHRSSHIKTCFFFVIFLSFVGLLFSSCVN